MEIIKGKSRFVTPEMTTWSNKKAPTAGGINTVIATERAERIASDEIYNRLIESNSLFVDVTTTNTTPVIGRKDLPYADFATANAAAAPGQTIVIINSDGTEDLVVKDGVNYIGLPEWKGELPQMKRLLDNGTAAVSDVTNIRFNAGALSTIAYLSNAATTVTLYYSHLEGTGANGLILDGALDCVDVTCGYSGAGPGFTVLSTGRLKGLTKKGDFTITAGGTTIQNLGVAENLTLFLSGAATYKCVGGIDENVEVHADYNGAFAYENDGGNTINAWARNLSAQGYRDINGGQSYRAYGEGAGNGSAGGRTIKGTGIEVGSNNPVANIGCRAFEPYSKTHTDESLVAWPDVDVDSPYGISEADGLEVINVIGARVDKPRGRSKSTLANGVILSMQNPNIPAHGIAGTFKTIVTNPQIVQDNPLNNHAAFTQGEDCIIIGGSISHVAGGAVISQQAGTTLKVYGTDLFTTGTAGGGAYAIKSDNGSAATVDFTGTKNTPLSAEITNIAFDPEARADTARRDVIVTARPHHPTQEQRIVVAEIATAGGSVYSVAPAFKIIFSTRAIGTTVNASVAWNVYKAAAQDAHVSQWRIECETPHFADSSTTEKPFKLLIKLKDQDYAYPVIEFDGGTDPGANKNFMLSVIGLSHEHEILGTVDSTKGTGGDIFSDASATINETIPTGTGTFTPTLGLTGATGTYTTQGGKYNFDNGNCKARGYIEFVCTGSGTVDYINGLPMSIKLADYFTDPVDVGEIHEPTALPGLGDDLMIDSANGDLIQFRNGSVAVNSGTTYYFAFSLDYRHD
jgi:hypothetical protein